MGKNRTWTADELDYLAEKWGVIRPAKIGEKLGRSEGAVVQKASKLGIGPFLEAGGYVSLNQLLIAVTGTNAAYSYKMKSWVENRGLPVHTKRYRKNSWRIVYLDEFWKWAEKNKAFLDFSKMEPLALGAEPDWVAEQRRRDTRSNALQRKDAWTPAEDDRLKLLLRQQRYSWNEIAHELNRSAGAIQRRINDLGLKDRPVRASSHNPWSEQDFQLMADMIREGYSYGQIADAVGRSEKAVRGRVYDTYWTENADKVRETLNFACDLVIEEICNYCNLLEVPDQLLNTAALMVRGLYNSTQLGTEQMQPVVKGVSRGDTSYSFASVAEQMAQLASSGDFLTDYRVQLNAFRKMRR